MPGSSSKKHAWCLCGSNFVWNGFISGRFALSVVASVQASGKLARRDKKWLRWLSFKLVSYAMPNYFSSFSITIRLLHFSSIRIQGQETYQLKLPATLQTYAWVIYFDLFISLNWKKKEHLNLIDHNISQLLSIEGAFKLDFLFFIADLPKFCVRVSDTTFK